jgi:epoxyqueuosine reductase
LGWKAKNSNLLTQKVGSLYFAELIDLDLELWLRRITALALAYDACPTQAIVEPYVVDGSKCISYYYRTKREYSREMKGSLRIGLFTVIYVKTSVLGINSLNRIMSPCSAPNPDVLSMTRKDWDEITEETFGQY